MYIVRNLVLLIATVLIGLCAFFGVVFFWVQKYMFTTLQMTSLPVWMVSASMVGLLILSVRDYLIGDIDGVRTEELDKENESAIGKFLYDIFRCFVANNDSQSFFGVVIAVVFFFCTYWLLIFDIPSTLLLSVRVYSQKTRKVTE